jgi:hypothetical protein
MRTRISILFVTIVLAACGNSSGGADGNGGNGDGGNGDGSGPVADADNHPDGTLPQGCGSGPAGDTQCSDCIDNDMDGTIDGYDIECTGAADDDEASFATGIPGDNMDLVNQDCFFDGNSGGGDDGCNIHVCCLLGAPDQASCPFGPQQYDPAECATPQQMACINECAALTPPGCDCFGCCTICDPATNQCRDIITNPATAPDCNEDTILDPVACPSCTKVTSCETPCNPEMCILCPGQDPSDLPPTCTGAECPGGAAECSTMPCPNGEFCSNGCCVGIIE